MPTVSVIVPVYNVEKYLYRCVDSILNQTFTDFELILVDDGSPDGSGAICDEYAKKDGRIVVIHKENGGVSSARNAGLDCAKGDYIMFCDSDDYVQTMWIEKMRELMVTDLADLGICGFYMIQISEESAKRARKVPEELQGNLPKSMFWSIHRQGLLQMPWNKIYLKSVIDENRLRFKSGYQYGEDELFVLEYIRSTKGRFAVCGEPLINYMQGIEGSLTRRYVRNLWQIWKEIYKERKKTLDFCGIAVSDIKNSYYNNFVWGVVLSLNNNMRRESELTWRKLMKENQEILSSEECKLAFRYGNFKDFHPIYTICLKTRCFFLVWLFHLVVRLKHKIFK